MKTKLVTALSDFYNYKKVKPFGSPENQIRHNTTWGKLERVWNDGNGLISFAKVAKDGKLLINELFCSPAEIKDIQKNLEIPVEFVRLGYPDYYTKGLEDVRKAG